MGDETDVKLGTNYFLNELADDVDLATGEIKGALTVPVFWDHGRGILGPKRLGKAVPSRITQEGIEYMIEIEKERAKEYQELIDAVYNEQMLGLSSQTLPSFASFDWSTGEIKGWFPAEMTLTVTPAEHRTRDGIEKLRSLFKKHGIEVQDMPKTKKDVEVVQTDEIVEDVEVVEEPETLSDEINSLFDELSSDINEEEETVVQNEALAYVIRGMGEIFARLDSIETALARSASAEDVEELSQSVEQANGHYVEAVRTMTERIGEILVQTVRNRAAELVQGSSDTEIQALRSISQKPANGAGAAAVSRSGYPLPLNAPGQG